MRTTHTLDIDIETRSSYDLNEVGVYKYVSSPDFKILLLAYTYDEQPDKVKVLDLALGDTIPKTLKQAIIDGYIPATEQVIENWAHNSNFERICLGKHFEADISPNHWKCSRVLATELGLPGSLANLSVTLHLKDAKMAEGKDLIKFFCKPKKDGTFNEPKDYPEKWEVFKTYNKYDVLAELEIKKKLSKFTVPPIEWRYWRIDQIINDRGVGIDVELATACRDIGAKIKEKYTKRALLLSGLENPNSTTQIKKWVNEQGIATSSIDKNAVNEILATTDNEKVKEFLTIRQILGKSSTTKYQTMLDCEVDGRAHGLIQFYGAERTGRFAGRLIQVQNLPQNHLYDIDLIREVARTGDLSNLEMLFDNPTQVLSELIRTAIIPTKGYTFAVADYSAIEARVIAWLTGETWRMQAFADGKDIYCASASAMFKVPVEKHGANAHLRQKGKVAELACGYGGSVGALQAFGADKLGLTEQEMKDIVDQWREASPHIVSFWWELDRAVKNAVVNGESSTLGARQNIKVYFEKPYLCIKLPSGRSLRYLQPKLEPNKFGGEEVTYFGTHEGHWTRIGSYGCKFTENIVQAISRDLLCNGLLKAEERGLRPVMHVHDEIIAEVKYGETGLKELTECMEDLPTWADGLLVRADGYNCNFYLKD